MRSAIWGVGSVLSAVLLVTTSGCSGDLENSGSGGNGGTGNGGGTGGAGAFGGGTVEPSGYLLISKDRKAEIEQAVLADAPEWSALLSNCAEYSGSQDIWHTSPENYALAYLFTGDEAYAREAYEWVAEWMTSEDVTSGSYLYIGDILRPMAIVLNYCADALSADEKQELAAYIDTWLNELWFDNQGSGWGLADPGNNYHMAFIQATAYGGYALRGYGHDNGQKYIDLAIEKIEDEQGVLAYLQERVQGGDWHEGANYGERSKQRLFSALSAIASMGDDNYFNADSYFTNSIDYAIYATQPDHASLYPGGDLAADVAMPVSPYERDYLQTAVFWLVDQEEGKNRGQWYLENVSPTYDVSGYQAHLHKDVLYGLDIAAVAPADVLPLSYVASGTEFVNARGSWAGDATSVSISGTPIIDQSHAHFDTGSFTLFKGQWLAVDAATYSDSGLTWASDAHNMVHVSGADRDPTTTPGLVHFIDEGDYAYAQVDSSGLFNNDAGPMLEEYTRELVYVRPDAVFVFDRVKAGSGSVDYDFRIHFASTPTDQGGGRYAVTNGDAGLSLLVMADNPATIASDGDLIEGSSSASRISVAKSGTESRFMAVLLAASGAPPALTAAPVDSSDAIAGASFADQVVVASDRPMGAAASLPFSYTVSSAGPLRHTLLNLEQSVDVNVSTAGGSTTVVVSAGSSYAPNEAGTVSVGP